MKWLVTAFEPFNGASSNSSLTVLTHLQQRPWADRVRFLAPIPTSFARAWPVVRATLSEDVGGVIALGQAETRTRISLERIALNWIDARIADNDGARPAQGPILEGQDALWSTIPWDRVPDAPELERSYSAGTFVCNSLLYQMLAEKPKWVKYAGFVHIPRLDSQQDATLSSTGPRMADATAVDVVTRLLQFALTLP